MPTPGAREVFEAFFFSWKIILPGFEDEGTLGAQVVVKIEVPGVCHAFIFSRSF